MPIRRSRKEDVKVLHSMGYAQELERRMSRFSNFAVSFSIICILSGGINSFAQGTSSSAERERHGLDRRMRRFRRFRRRDGADRLGLPDRGRGSIIGDRFSATAAPAG